MGQYKSEHQDFKSSANAGFTHGCCCLSVSLRAKTSGEIKGSMGQWKSEGKDFMRDYAKEKLTENMGQSESKERDFKE
jgi:hypothetical protein